MCAIIRTVIDLHSHILPGIDDGPATMEGSLDLARAAVEAGTNTILATPHINDDPSIDPARIAAALVELRAALAAAEIPLEVLPGGEIAIWRLIDLDDDTLRALALGGGPYLLVESPFSPVIGDFEPMVLDLHRARPPRPARPPGALPGLPEDARAARGARRRRGAGADHGGLDDRRLRVDRAPLHRRRSCATGSRTSSPPTPTTPCAARRGCRPASRRSSASCRASPSQAEWLTQLVPRAVLDGTPVPAAAAVAEARRPAAPARAQSLTIAMIALATTAIRIRTCIQ